MPLWIRPRLVPSSRTIATIKAAGANVYALGRVTMAGSAGAVPGQPGAWILSSGFVNAAGQPVSTVPTACESAIQAVQGPRNPVRLNTCLTSHGIRVIESYQPLSHYWPLQLTETGLSLALALALAGFCFWRLGRRRT